MIRVAFVALFCLGSAGYLAASVLKGLRNGKIRSGNGILVRHDRPMGYWITVAVQIVFTGMFLFVLYRELLRT